MKNAHQQQRFRFLGKTLFVYLLSASLQSIPVLAKEVVTGVAAQTEVLQIKLDHLKETQKSDADTLNKRIDDALTTTGQAIDRFGVVTAWIGSSQSSKN
jgi:hypothetical protein